MNCPECGRFMKLEYAGEIGRDATESAYWWICTNIDDCIQANCSIPVPAPEYDWMYWYDGISAEDLAADPELRAEYDKALQRYLNRPTARQKERG